MFTLTATDKGSGVNAIYYSLDSGATTAYAGPVAVTNIVHTLQYWSVDNVGNVEATHTVTLPIEAPSIAAIAPTYIYAGSTDTTITVNGADFSSNSAVLWNGVALVTTYVSDSQLTAVVPAADLRKVTTIKISVTTPGTGGGTSAKVAFPVLTPPDSGGG